MTPFTTNKLNTQEIITIINVGSYKVRTVICSFSFSGVKILGYGEKRQSRLDIVNNEINNIAGVCESIQQSILKAEQSAGYSSKTIIINPFLSNTFYSPKKIHRKQTDNTLPIKRKELNAIIDSIEKQSLHSSFQDIYSKFGIDKSELQLIFGTISEIKIDGKQKSNLLGETGEDIKIKNLNLFIPKMNYQLIKDISHYLGKDILNIIPEEYAISKIGTDEENVVFIDIGNTSTFVSITQNKSFQGAIRIDTGIDDLVKSITQNTDKTRAEIIKKLDRDDLFKIEKQQFLSLFSDLLIAAIKEVIGSNICPHYFLLTGGGADNNFIKEHILKIPFPSQHVNILKEVSFISPSIKRIKHIIGVENILKISNLNLIAQILCTQKILSSKQDPVEQALGRSMKQFTVS